MVAQGHPTALRMAAEERWDVIPGAEPAGAFAGRVRSQIERLAARHPGQRVAAFTHGGVIGQPLALAARPCTRRSRAAPDARPHPPAR
jgi:probable phosphoglycerate mutase